MSQIQGTQVLRTVYSSRAIELARLVFPTFVVSRSIVLLVAFGLEWLLDTGRAFRYGFIGNAPLAPLSATFDANWYSSIATGWYNIGADPAQQSNLHFMPLYPVLMKVVGGILGLGGVHGGYNLAGVVLSHICFFVALMLLYQLTLDVWRNEKLALRTVWIISSLPWAFVFSMAYTESLYLALLLGALLIAYRIRTNPNPYLILYSGLLAGLATLTRHTGLFVACCVIWLVAVTPQGLTFWQRLRNMVLGGAPSVLAFGGFVLYIGLQTGRLLSVVSAHDAWGNGYINDLPRLLVLPPANPAWTMDFLEFLGLVVWVVLSIGAVAVLISAHRRRDRGTEEETSPWPGAWAFVGYAGASIVLLLIIQTANESWGRYMMTVFPCMWPLGRWLVKQRAFRVFISMALTLQVVFFAAAILEQVTP